MFAGDRLGSFGKNSISSVGVRVHLGEDERLEAEQNGARAGGHQHQVVIGACAQLDNGPGHLPTSMSPTKGCF